MHKRLLSSLFILFLIATHGFTATLFTWWNQGGNYRIPVTVKAALGEEQEAPVQIRLNFGALVKEGQRFDPNSIHVVEQDGKTGQVITEVPALFQPVDSHWPGVVPLNWHEPYDGKTPPLIRASSENPAFPAKSLVASGTGWEPADPKPPWIAAIDLGTIQTINSVFLRTAYNGYGRGSPTLVTLETATESADGLREGQWQAAGGWENADGWYVNGFMRPIFFAPRSARYVRLVIKACNSDVPRFAQFSVYGPFWDPLNRAEGRVSWFVPGRTGTTERTFFVYFNNQNAASTAVPPPQTVAVFREAEEAVNLYSPPGISFNRGFDTQASGPSIPNMLTYSYEKDIYWPPAGFAVTLPRTDKYVLHLRLRASLRDHAIRLVWDTREIFKGTFSVQGEGWSVISLPPMELTEGVHYLEVLMLGGSERPLDLDWVMLTNATKFIPNQGLLANPGRVEVRP